MNFFEIPLLISFIISVLWIVGITNAFNWLDGLDGLAAGVGAIISFGFFILNLINGQAVLGFFFRLHYFLFVWVFSIIMLIQHRY